MTECGWNGTDLYADLVDDETISQAAAWYYCEPEIAAEHIKNHIAFSQLLPSNGEVSSQPLTPILSHGQRSNVIQAPASFEGFSTRRVLADKMYGSNVLRQTIADTNAETVIPSNPTRKRPIPHDFNAYKAGSLIGRSFNKLKYVCQLAIRYDRRDTYFLSLLNLAAAIAWIR